MAAGNGFFRFAGEGAGGGGYAFGGGQTRARTPCRPGLRSRHSAYRKNKKDTLMIQTLLTRYRRAGASRRLFTEARYISDPLSHPVLRAMSQRELADLPFGRDETSRGS